MGALDGIADRLSSRIKFRRNHVCFNWCVCRYVYRNVTWFGADKCIAIMLPITYGMDPTMALVMMAGVYYGAVFGGSTSSILLNAPGISGTVASAFDGYPMAQQGKAGKALAIAAISSFVGGTISVVLLMIFAPMLASVAISFGPPAYFALDAIGLISHR